MLKITYIIRSVEIMTEQGISEFGGNVGSVPSPEKKESFFSSSKITDPGRAPLSILVKITKEDGESLPYLAFVEEIFQNNTGITTLEVLILNNQDALVDLADGVSVTEIAMAVHMEGRLRDRTIRVGCLISGRASLMSMEKEREKYHLQKEDLEKEKLELEAREREARITLQEDSIQMKNEFAGYRVQINEVMMRVTEQLNSLEIMWKDTENKIKGDSKGGRSVD